MDKKYTTLFLIVLLMGFGSTLSARCEYLPKVIIEKDLNCNGLGCDVHINEFVDRMVLKLRPFIVSQGLDPLKLPDMIEGFEVKPFLVTYSAWLRLHSGWATGLVNLSRSGNQILSYYAKMLRARIQLRFFNIELNGSNVEDALAILPRGGLKWDRKGTGRVERGKRATGTRYDVRVMNIGPEGGLHGSWSQFDIVFDCVFDLNNLEIQLQELSLLNVGEIHAYLSGNPLVDWIMTPVVNIFLKIFDDIVINEVETRIRSSVQDTIIDINVKIKETISKLEQ